MCHFDRGTGKEVKQGSQLSKVSCIPFGGNFSFCLCGSRIFMLGASAFWIVIETHLLGSCPEILVYQECIGIGTPGEKKLSTWLKKENWQVID